MMDPMANLPLSTYPPTDQLGKSQTKPLYITSVQVEDGKDYPLSDGVLKSILSPVLAKPLQSLSSTLASLETIEKNLMYTGLYQDISITLDHDKSRLVNQFLSNIAPKEYDIELPLPVKALVKVLPAPYQRLSLVTTTRDSYASAGGRLASVNKFGLAEVFSLQADVNYTPFSGKLDDKLVDLRCLVPFQNNPSIKAVFDVNYAMLDLYNQPWINEDDQHKQRQIGFNIGIQKQWLSKRLYSPTAFAGVSIVGRNLDGIQLDRASYHVSAWADSSLKTSFVTQFLHSNRKLIGTFPVQGMKFNAVNELVLSQTVAGTPQEETFNKFLVTYEKHVSFLRNLVTTSLDLSCGSLISTKQAAKPMVHIMDQFYLGGLSSLKGFHRNSVGSRGGDLFYRLSLKSSVHLPGTPLDSPLRLQAFFNAGDVFHFRRQIPEDVAAATGLSLVYESPIANLDLTYALPLTSRPVDLAKPGFSFGVAIAYR
ncbi:AER403Cp [Eremothecium gossypii ATCC 10895]|uniref:AER403Cp n=1 Tax=Eremothecium gossypii (strain ATCC 10895 / CBS 109.51 / FGSC 9923 / NRRL Y-1056) TaxID=284811 RepID=Q755W5_EREGS|nr:AER403Cp [Eremothecium gossypii ATCC 10895]AAS53082.2 AER403Cp [Eremothecium gossypii ATCC 10895]AEY97391.1 FAER403Cp [Eremothecium gossypii FDAG1]